MPELPEVETICQALKPALEGHSIQKIQLNRLNLRYPIPPDLENIIAHYPIKIVRRRAKYLLVEFSHNLTLIWHLGMSGRILIGSQGTPLLNSNPHNHIVFTMSHGQQIIYHDPRRFGFLRLCPTNQLNEVRPFCTLGPEPLDDAHHNSYIFHTNLVGRRISLKSALLDQKIVAGVGNIYATEALWQAKLSPFRLTNTITPLEAEKLLIELQDVLRRAIAAGGSTLRDHLQPNGDSGYFQHKFRAYNRKNKLCNHCQLTPLCKIMQNGRATYYCKACQQ